MLRILGGRHRSRPLSAPKTGLKPSMGALREALFNILSITPMDRFVDLFSGSGAIGLEALSRGAQEVVFVERDRGSCKVIEANLHKFGEEGRVVASDALDYLKHYQGEPFDIIFADPPYDQHWPGRVLELVDSLPILRPGGFCFIEERGRLSPPELKTLNLVKERRYGSSNLYQWEKL